MKRKLEQGLYKVYLVELLRGTNTLTGELTDAIKVGITSYVDALDRFTFSKKIGEPSMIDYFKKIKCINSVIIPNREEAEKIENYILRKWGKRDFNTKLYIKGILEIRIRTLSRLNIAHDIINSYKNDKTFRKEVLPS
jgi:hypothetical protein